MCLILLAFQAHREVNLLLAGNRDEFFGRPSAPPTVIAANPAIFAGRDLEAGGTWMGRNEAGLMAALTNRRNPAAQIPADVRTRGEIVVKLLGHRQPELAAEWLEGLTPDRYRPFSVLFGDPTRFYYFSSEERGPPRSLAPGFYALSNSTLDDRSWPKVDRSHRFFEVNGNLPGQELVEKIQTFLADATPPGGNPRCARCSVHHHRDIRNGLFNFADRRRDAGRSVLFCRGGGAPPRHGARPCLPIDFFRGVRGRAGPRFPPAAATVTHDRFLSLLQDESSRQSH